MNLWTVAINSIKFRIKYICLRIPQKVIKKFLLLGVCLNKEPNISRFSHLSDNSVFIDICYKTQQNNDLEQKFILGRKCIGMEILNLLHVYKLSNLLENDFDAICFDFSVFEKENSLTNFIIREYQNMLLKPGGNFIIPKTNEDIKIDIDLYEHPIEMDSRV